MKKWLFTFIVIIVASLFYSSCSDNNSFVAENQVPTCSIIKPSENAIFIPDGDIEIDVQATDLDGIINEVKLYFNNYNIGVDSLPPYEFVISTNSLVAGNYLIKAIAMDNCNSIAQDSLSIRIENQLNSFETVYSTNEYDEGRSVIKTKDNGYAIFGYTSLNLYGEQDFLLIKVDSNGNILWRNKYSSTASENGAAFVQTNDEEYVMAGMVYLASEQISNFMLIKADKSGKEIWKKIYKSMFNSYCLSIDLAKDGGFILCGEENGDFCLLKTDRDGNELWRKTYGGSLSERAYSVKATNDGGYITAGYTLSYGEGSFDWWLVKTDSQGNEEWNKTFGDGLTGEEAKDVQQTEDGGYIILGSTAEYPGNANILLIKTDEFGNAVWQKSYGGIGAELGSNIQLTSDNGFIIIGSTESYGLGGYDIWLIKTDNNGDIEWSRTFGTNYQDHGYSTKQLNDYSFVLLGTSNSFGELNNEIMLIKTDSLGYVKK